jgi:hypothetical protein
MYLLVVLKDHKFKNGWRKLKDNLYKKIWLPKYSKISPRRMSANGKGMESNTGQRQLNK